MVRNIKSPSSAQFWSLRNSSHSRFTQLSDFPSHPIPGTVGSLLLASFPEYVGPDHLLMLNYPDHHWEPWKFAKLAIGWRGEMSDLIRAHDPIGIATLTLLLDRIALNHNAKALKDWYAVPVGELDPSLSSLFLKATDSLAQALALAYPHHKWNPKLFIRSPVTAKQQKSLAGRVEKLLPKPPKT